MCFCAPEDRSHILYVKLREAWCGVNAAHCVDRTTTLMVYSNAGPKRQSVAEYSGTSQVAEELHVDLFFNFKGHECVHPMTVVQRNTCGEYLPCASLRG